MANAADLPYNEDMDEQIPRQPPQDWLDALDRADADLAAGRTVDGDRILSDLRRTIAEMEARHAGKPISKGIRRH